MDTSPLSPIKRLEWLIGIAFLGFSCFKILTTPIPALQSPDPAILSGILKGSNKGVPVLGEEFDPFRPYVSPGETYSFIMDLPFNGYGNITKQIYTAQSRLAPVLLNPAPGEKNALVYCSNTAVAMQRLEESGYTLVRPLADGKGLAVKKS